MRDACDDFMDALLGGPLPEEQRAHAVVCEVCRALIGDHGVHGAEAPAPLVGGGMGAVFREELKAQALAELAARPTALRWGWEVAGLLTLSVLVLLLAVALFGMDGFRLSNAPPWRKTLAALALFGGVSAFSFAALLPRGQRLRKGLLFATALAPVLVLFGADGQRVFTTVSQGLPCAMLEVLLSAAPVALAVYLSTRTAFQPQRVWLAAAGGGTVGLLALHLRCIDGSAKHLLGYHVLPALLVASGAVLLRARLPSRTFAP